MKQRRITILIALMLVAVFAVTAVAQQRQGSSQWSAMREKYKYTFQLMTMVRHIAEIDKDKKYTLTQSQAKQVLDILKPLRSQPKLTQDQARTTAIKLKKVFTATQLNAMARIKPKAQSGPGGRPGGSTGNRPPQGTRRPDPNAMKDFNPFYAKAPKDDAHAQARLKMWNEFFTALEKKAKTATKTK